MIEMLKSKGVHWETEVPFILKHGVYVKKENYEIEALQGGKVLRTRVAFKAFKVKYGEFFSYLMLSKMWSEDEKLIEENGILSVDLVKDFV